MELLEVGGNPGLGRRRRLLAALIVLGVAAAIVVLSLRSSPRHPVGSTATSAPTVRPSSAGPSTVGTTAAGPRAACRDVAGCVVSSTVPPGVATLARTRLSPDVVLHVRTSLVPGSGNRPSRVIERDVTAYFRSATVLVRVAHAAGHGALTPDPPGTGSLLLHRNNAGFDVLLQYLAPETVPPMMTNLLRLMTDPQLTWP